MGKSRGNEPSQRERRAVSHCVYDKPFREFRPIALAVPIRWPWLFNPGILHVQLRLRRAEAEKVCRFFGMSRNECRTDSSGCAGCRSAGMPRSGANGACSEACRSRSDEHRTKAYKGREASFIGDPGDLRGLLCLFGSYSIVRRHWSLSLVLAQAALFVLPAAAAMAWVVATQPCRFTSDC